MADRSSGPPTPLNVSLYDFAFALASGAMDAIAHPNRAGAVKAGIWIHMDWAPTASLGADAYSGLQGGGGGVPDVSLEAAAEVVTRAALDAVDLRMGRDAVAGLTVALGIERSNE